MRRVLGALGTKPCLSYSSFCTEFVAGLVKWLELPGAVLPTMTAFANGLGGEGADVFAAILLKDPILKDDPLVIIQVHPPPRGCSWLLGKEQMISFQSQPRNCF